MATIIRVKRRQDEDPAESLLIQCKRSRTDSFQTDETKKFCLSLVTTVNSKDAAIPRHVQKALRRQHLQSNYKTHEHKHVQRSEAKKKASERAVSRYKIVNSKRALPVVDLAKADSTDLSESDSEEQTSKDNKSKDNTSKTQLQERLGKGTAKNAQRVSKDTEPGSASQANTAGGCTEDSRTAESGADDKARLLQVFDVEQEVGTGAKDSDVPHPSNGSGITLNNQNLVSQPVLAPLATPESNYVYDLYYINTNNQQYDFRELENILSIEALHDELVHENDREDECQYEYDDEDDSNDENNWRNDYPDEDPDKSDSEEENEFAYGFDHETLGIERPRNFSYKDEDFLVNAMGTNLQLFDDSSSDEEDEYSGKGSSYKAYMRRAKQDLEEGEGEESD